MRDTIPSVAWIKTAADAGTVGFLGCNPAHGWRCVIAGKDPETGDSFIAKLGLDASAHAIEREHAVLNVARGVYPGIVASQGCESGHDWAMLRLPHLGNVSPSSMRAPEIATLLDSWILDEVSPLSNNPWAMNLIQNVARSAVHDGWHQRMMSHRIHHAFTHGDFAVWNMRVTNSGVSAIDLEWAAPNGVAGIDLIHGLRQEGYMVRKMSSANTVKWMLDEIRSSNWSGYLGKSGWSESPEDLLTLGLLHSHFNAINDSTALLAELGVSL